MEAPESLHLISLIPLPWSLFNQTRYVCGGPNYGNQRCPALVPRICYLTWPRNSSNVIQVLGLIRRLPGIFKVGPIWSCEPLKAEDLLYQGSVREMPWKTGRREEV